MNNAFKFTQEGNIIISVKRVNHSINISIKDTGTGIDPAILPVLFTKFAKEKSSSGTGLGLYISRVLSKPMVVLYGLTIIKMGEVPHLHLVFH